MKKVLFTLLVLAGSLWGCEKESQNDVVSPQEQQKSYSTLKSGVLTSEEKAAADAMGKLIPLSTFRTMTEAYKNSVSSTDTRAVAYGATVLDQVLSQKGCVGIRFYLAKDANGATTIVFVGVDKKGNDITSNPVGRTTNESSTGGAGPLCPKECSGGK